MINANLVNFPEREDQTMQKTDRLLVARGPQHRPRGTSDPAATKEPTPGCLLPLCVFVSAAVQLTAVAFCWKAPRLRGQTAVRVQPMCEACLTSA